MAAPAFTLPASKAIVPGKSIGHLRIGATQAAAEKLGKEADGDCDIAQCWLTWYSKPSASRRSAIPAEIDVYTTLNSENPDQPRVQQIRVTSSYFKTKNGISVGSGFARIKRAYPRIKLIETYATKKTNGPIQIYSDIKGGIAFEIYRGREGKAAVGLCAAILVHSPRYVTERDGRVYDRLTAYLKDRDAGGKPFHSP